MALERLEPALSDACGIVTVVRIYVAGPTADTQRVRAVQSAVVAAGHELTFDWSRGPDAAIQRRPTVDEWLASLV